MNRKIEEYWRSKPHTFRFLESMQLQREIGDYTSSPFTLTLTLLNTASLTAIRAVLRFRGVRGLKVGDLEGLPGILLEITDVGDRQMEHISFHVIDSESRSMEFFCLDFEIEVEKDEVPD